MSEHVSEAGRALTRFERRLRLRVIAWASAGALALGFGTAAAAVGLGGVVVGAAPSPWVSSGWWVATLVAAGWVARRALRTLSQLRGAAVANVLEVEDPGLALDARSALELIHQPSGSGDLIEALLQSVRQRIEQLDLASVTRPSPQAIQMALGTLLCGGTLLWLVSATDRGQAGLFALMHPSVMGDEGREGVWIDRLELDVAPPAHIRAVATRYLNPHEVKVHAGSRITLRVRPHMHLSRASLSIGELELQLARQESGSFEGHWVAEAEGAIALKGWSDGWLRDARPRSLVVVRDQAPRAHLSEPAEDLRVAPDQRVVMKFSATDDHGLAGVDLVVRGPGAQEHRQRIAAPASGERRLGLSGEMVLRASDFEVSPGDTLSLWLEASDLNRHVGPLVGHSEIRTLTVAGERSAEGAAVDGLTRAREQALELLAERLEFAVPPPERAARKHQSARAAATRSWLATLHEVEGHVEEDTAELLRGMQRRVRGALRKEQILYRRHTPRGPRLAANETAITALEGDVLWLADLLARARVEDAEAVLAQIHAAEGRMRSLLGELAQAPDEARKRALLAEVARMRAQIAELMSKLRDVRGTVPAEFVNREAMKATPQADALQELEAAIESGEVEKAQAALDTLTQQLAQLEQGLGETGVALASARFKPRNDATAKTLRQLEQLEGAQRSLSQETSQIGRNAAARGGAADGTRAEAEKLGQEADELADRLDKLGADRLSGALAESRATATQRLRDVRDSLASGDYFEGETMARHAAAEMRGIARELDMDARMFPGSDSSLKDVAEGSAALQEQAERLAQRVSEAAPDLDKLLDAESRQQVRGQSTPQGELARDTHAAREKLSKAQDDDGVSAGASERLGDVEGAMRRATDALKRGDIEDAQSHQREAMERMAQLRQDLARQARAGSPKGSGEDGQRPSGQERGEDDERVEIPEDADASRRDALRRRVLDARRGDTPAGYEAAVERFYEGLLR